MKHLIFLLFPLLMQGQSRVQSDLLTEVRRGRETVTLEVDERTLMNIVAQDKQDVRISLTLPDGLAEVTLERTVHDHAVTVNGRPFDGPKGVHYRGKITGVDNSLVTASFYNNILFVSGATASGNFEVTKRIPTFVGRIRDFFRRGDNSDEYISKYVKDAPPEGCQTTDAFVVDDDFRLREVAGADAKCVPVHVEADYSIVENFASTEAAIQYFEALFNKVSSLYAADGMSLYMSYLSVWDDPALDPFAGITSSGNGLDKVCAYGAANGINGKLIHLLSDNGSGGIAYVNILNSGISYRCSFSSIYGTGNFTANYTWDAQVIAHEIGHNVASKHTHACVWNGNNTRIDNCGPSRGYSEGDCPNGVEVLPVGGGTIMSYCHLTSVGISFLKGFGPQPTALMQSKIALYGAACNLSCPGVQADVTNVTTNSATITWAASDVPGATYVFEFDGDIIATSALTSTITGLSPSTVYSASVTVNCGAAGSSYPTSVSFKTPCASPIVLNASGYTEDFNNGKGGWAASPETLSGFTTWEFGVSNTKPSLNGGNIWETNLDSFYLENERGYVQSPCFDFSNVTTASISFEFIQVAESTWDGSNLQYSIDGGINWVILGGFNQGGTNWYTNSSVYALDRKPGWTGHTNLTIPWRVSSHDLSPVLGKPLVSFRMFFASDVLNADYSGCGFDNVKIVTQGGSCSNQYASVSANTCNPSQAGVTVDSTAIGECWLITTTTTTLRPSHNITVNATTCIPSQAGTFVNTYDTQYGCDSTVTRIVTLLPSDAVTVHATTCNPSEAGTEIVIHVNQHGCDSTITTITALLPSYSIVVNALTCDPSEVGTVALVYAAANGCDSTVTTITSLDVNCGGGCEGFAVDIGDCYVSYKGYTTAHASIPITANTTGGAAPFSYVWNVSSRNQKTIPFIPRLNTDVTVTATDAQGCTATDVATAYVVDVRCGLGNIKLCLNAESLCKKRNEVQGYLNQGATLGDCGATPCD